MSRFLVRLLLLLSLSVHAEVVTIPSAPVAGQAFEVVVRGVWGDSCIPQPQRLLIANHDLYESFTLSGSVCLSVLTPYEVSFSVPPLAAGTYQLHARLVTGTPAPLLEKTIVVSGTPPAITNITPSFDRAAGNRVIKLTGNFPGANAPEVFFGTKRAESFARVGTTEMYAVAPLQTNVRTVDIIVRGEGYEYVVSSGFTYVSDDEYEAVLIPITTRQAVPGAHGSLWQSEVRLVNRSGLTLVPGIDFFPTADAAPVPPNRVITPAFVMPRPDVDDPPTVLLFVRSELLPSIAFQARTRDLSRSTETWGTEIPVVRARDMKTTFTLLDVPMRDGFRQMLRLYIPEYAGCCGAAVIFYSPEGEVLGGRSVPMAHPDGSIGGLAQPPYVLEGSRQLMLQPAYGQLDLQTVPELRGHDTIWMFVQTSAQRIWGFVSVTNDATQHVTTITPQ